MPRLKAGELLYGVGTAAPLIHATPYDRKMRKTWGGMLERCYSPIKQTKNYDNVTVCDNWLVFENFAEWYRENYTPGLHLDKDLIDGKGTCYSPATCSFVPQWLNNLLISSEAARGVLPLGVTLDTSGKYKARLSCHNISNYLGLFDTIDAASSAYNRAKGAHILSVINHPDVPNQTKPYIRSQAVQLLGGH
jgi:hypothetical protein